MRKAIIAMSGGVDSSVAALLTKETGDECIGAIMKLFHNEDIGVKREKTCCSLDDVEDARNVCYRMGIRYYVFNFSERFKEDVMDRFVDAYEHGATPNPCIDCNRYLKFDKMFQRMRELEYDYIVTGHYARVEYDEEKNQIQGTLKKTLPFKNGLTCYSDLGDGYFTAKHEIGVDRWIFGLSIGILVITAALFVLFGRDEKIIPSIQYQPPEGMDSAVVGYVLDGSVDDKDVISLILYWADKGYLKMKEKGQKDMEFIKLKDIPDSEPRYQKTMFEALFKNRKKVKASSLQYKFADTVQVVKDDIKYDYATDPVVPEPDTEEDTLE